MGLDDLIEDARGNRYPVGEVSSRMKPSSIGLSRFGWAWIIAHYPEAAGMIARNTSEEGAKLVINIIDDLLEDEVHGLQVRESSKEEFKRIREGIIDRKL
jgi:hypothetical protein